MRCGVASLRADADECLHAIHSTTRTDSFDVENVLFYNVGVGYFAQAARSCVRFELASPRASGHHWEYTIAPRNNAFIHYKLGDRPAAVWHDEPLAAELATSAKPVTYWRAIKSARQLVSNDMLLGRFALRIELLGPLNEYNVNIVGLMKCLLDGVICAFHSHEGDIPPSVLNRLQNQLGTDCNPDELCTWLVTPGPLGPRPLLRTHSWNPRDNDCVACEIRISRNPDRPTWSWSGALDSVLPIEP